MPLWAKVDVDMPTDGKLFGQPIATRHLWTCLICLAKRQDEQGVVRGYDCALLASAYNLPRKGVADALTHFQSQRMIELDVDGSIRLVNFEKRQGQEDSGAQRAQKYYESHRETVLAKRKVSRAQSHAVSRENTVRTSHAVSRETVSLEVEVEQKRTEVEVEQSREELEEAKSKSVAPQSAARPPTAALWEAYSAAYEKRYGAVPVRNATVNAQLSAVLKRLGAEEAPEVAAFYVEHPGAFYGQKGHPVGVLLLDAEKLRMEWATGKRITGTEARQQERTAANFGGWERMLKREPDAVG